MQTVRFRVCGMSHPLGTPNAHTRQGIRISLCAPPPARRPPLSYRRYARAPFRSSGGGRISLHTPHVVAAMCGRRCGGWRHQHVDTFARRITTHVGAHDGSGATRTGYGERGVAHSLGARAECLLGASGNHHTTSRDPIMPPGVTSRAAVSRCEFPRHPTTEF